MWKCCNSAGNLLWVLALVFGAKAGLRNRAAAGCAADLQ
jgi:hypothetical protein